MYSQEVADRICQQLAEGRSLRAVCREDGMPAMSTVYRWLDDERYKAFRDDSTRAREIGCHALADECLAIADDGENDWLKDDAGYRANGENVQRSKLRIETRMRLLGKWLPKVYGEKTAHEITGADGKAIEYTHIERAIVDPVSRAIASDEGNNTATARAAHRLVQE